MPNQKVIAIVGPTASGKSSLGVFIAQKIGGEIISADSRQVYKGLDIATGKITKKDMGRVPHHLLDVANPKQLFSADDFVRLASKAIEKIGAKRHIPIVVGGTGYYCDALLGRLTLPQVAPNEKLRAQLEKKTPQELLVMLQALDPRRASTIEQGHKRRLIRAIEIAKALGKSPEPRMQEKYEVLWLGLSPAPKILQKNIRSRVLARLKAGMVSEAKRLHTRGLSYKRMQELGLEYRLLAQYLQGKLDKDELVAGVERGNREYAKRQIRWFKRNPEIHWIKNPGRAGKTEALRLAKKFIAAAVAR